MGIRHVATMHNFGCLDPELVERSMTLFARDVMRSLHLGEDRRVVGRAL
jgi:hypothetical protein